MDIQQIITIANSSISVIAVVIYTIVWFKNNKKTATASLLELLKNVPQYLNEVNSLMPNASEARKVKLVQESIKDDCKELKIKYKNKLVKNKIEEAIENEK